LIVVDAPVVVAWLLDENVSEAPASIFDTLADEIVAVPCHWPLEIGNALRSQLKTGRLTAHDFLKVMEDLDMLHVRVEPPLHPDEIGPLVKFSVDNALTAYDAAYVQLALRQHAILLTLDKNMRSAAQTLNIPVLPA
jgi:predicted nucleic acid-binding protein